MALTCVVCRGEDFDETEEGFYVCQVCGTQSQDVVREVADEELQFNTAGAGITGSARRVRTPKRRSDTPGADPRGGTHGGTPAGPGSRVAARFRNADASEDASPESRAALDRVVAYCDGVQRLLRTQCDALVETMGFPEAIRAETRAVWLAYLDGSRILETDFADPEAFVEDAAENSERDERGTRAESIVRAEKNTDASPPSSSTSGDESASTESRSRSEKTDDEDRPGGAPERAARKLSREKKKSTFRAFVTRRFPVRCTLAAVYLACLRLRLPVHCGDITRWAADGRLPFLAESARVANGVAAREPEPSADSRRLNTHGSRLADVAARTVAARFAAPLASALVARGVPRTHLVAAFAARMAHVAERSPAGSRVAFPPTNAAAFVERFVGALRLGGAFREQAMRALCLYQAPGLRHARVSRAGAAVPTSSSDPNEGGERRTNPEPARVGGAPAPPHAHAAAIVVAAMKAAYDLSVGAEGAGSSGGESGSTGPEAFDEASRRWFLAVVARAESTTRDGVRPIDLASSRRTTTGRLARSPARADAFLAFCRDEVFGGRSVPPPRDRVVANLWRAYETSREEGEEEEDTAGTETETETETETAPNSKTRGDVFAPPPFRARAGPAAALLSSRGGKNGAARGSGDAYWRGPPVLADAPRAYRAVVETVAALACVAPGALHACVLDVDAALEARERHLRGEAEARKKEEETNARARGVARRGDGKAKPGREKRRRE